MENSKSAERWALVTAMPSLPCDLDLKVEGGIGGKTVPQERRTLGLGTSSACPPTPYSPHCPPVLLTPTAGPGVLALCCGTQTLGGIPGEVQGLGGKLSWWFGDP